MSSRPSIPADIKRSVRKRCNFGCVICGSPVIQYDHMVQYSDSRIHEPDNITLLCPFHHNEKTLSRLPLARVQEKNANPFNCGKDATARHPLSCFYGDGFGFWFGSNWCWTPMHPEGRAQSIINVDGGMVFGVRIERNMPLVRVILRNKENRVMLRIVDNELTYSTGVWDATYEANRFRLWHGKGALGLDMIFESDALRLTRCEFYANGLPFIIKGGSFNMAGQCTCDHCELIGCIYAGPVRERPGNMIVNLYDPQRYNYEADTGNVKSYSQIGKRPADGGIQRPEGVGPRMAFTDEL